METFGLCLFLNTHPLSTILLTAVSALAKDLGSLLLALFPPTPISSAQASLQLPNTGIDAKLMQINRKHLR